MLQISAALAAASGGAVLPLQASGMAATEDSPAAPAARDAGTAAALEALPAAEAAAVELGELVHRVEAQVGVGGYKGAGYHLRQRGAVCEPAQCVQQLVYRMPSRVCCVPPSCTQCLHALPAPCSSYTYPVLHAGGSAAWCFGGSSGQECATTAEWSTGPCAV